MRMIAQFWIGLTFLALSIVGAWADVTAAGVWETIDDKSGKAKSTVTISLSGGVYVGRVTTIFPDPGHPANPVCANCTGAAHKAPIKGLQIIDGMKQSGLEYTGGTILDPESGTVYNALMQLSPDGAHLVVRGYVGISAFGRSQTWNRVK